MDNGSREIVKFWKINFYCEQLGWAIVYVKRENDPIVVKTEDGGNNWEDVNITLKNTWGSLFIIDSNSVIVRDNDTLILTNDGGVNWRNLSGLNIDAINSYWFINPEVGTVIGHRMVER